MRQKECRRYMYIKFKNKKLKMQVKIKKFVIQKFFDFYRIYIYKRILNFKLQF